MNTTAMMVGYLTIGMAAAWGLSHGATVVIRLLVARAKAVWVILAILKACEHMDMSDATEVTVTRGRPSPEHEDGEP